MDPRNYVQNQNFLGCQGHACGGCQGGGQGILGQGQGQGQHGQGLPGQGCMGTVGRSQKPGGGACLTGQCNA